MLVAIDALPVTTDPSAKKVILFLPENELHEIGLLFYQYLLKKKGFKTIYLGQSVPFEDLRAVGDVHKADYFIGAIVSTLTSIGLEDYILQLGNTFSTARIILTGAAVSEIDFEVPANISIVKNIKEFQTFLSNL